ncbi:MAG: deoxyguanosinetriphosphate triphosphohydrolase [Halothece sp.]
MEWEKLLSKERLDNDEIKTEKGRNDFHKDYDRIIFSGAFRRLGKKTQVHPMPDNDHIHGRLSHSLEVSCVGRSLGMKVGEQLNLPEGLTANDLGTIVQSACLAHDIGNPPFGHVGEDAIRSWFQEHEEKYLRDLKPEEKMDLLSFEGNAQGFRIITQIEYRLFEGGMRLTYPTLGTYLKYPWTSKHYQEEGKKHGCNQAELHLLKKVTNQLGLVEESSEKWSRHPLAYLVEAADDICYALIDLEDAVEMGILPYEELERTWEAIIEGNKKQLEKSGYYKYEPTDSDRRKIASLRGLVIDHLVNSVVDTFIEYQESILAGSYDSKSLIAKSKYYLEEPINKAKEIAKDKIFNHARKVQLEIGSYHVIENLLGAFCSAAYELHEKGEEKLSYKNRRILDLMGTNKPQNEWSLYEKYLRILDYISGMTDNYATYIGKQIGGLAN